MDILVSRREALAMAVAATTLSCSDRSSAAQGQDATAFLQERINAAPAGGEVLIPAGTWRFSQLAVRTAGLTIRGTGDATVLRHEHPELNAITVSAPDVALADMRLEGTATAPDHSRFAIFTDTGNSAARMRVERLLFAGASARHGFTNAIKFDVGADAPTVRNCRFYQLVGNQSGFGYGILCGAITGGRFLDNWGRGQRGRGRHLVYLSSGASQCLVDGNEAVDFDYEAFTVYSLVTQPPSIGNVIRRNRVIRPAQAARMDFGGISLFCNVRDCIIEDNIVEQSAGSGIVLSGVGSTSFRNNRVIGNRVTDAAYFGIDIVAMTGGALIGNEISESSRAAQGTYSNIRIASDGSTPVDGLIIERNRSFGTRFSRSPLQMNTTPPMPRRIRMRDNDFRRGNLTGVELNGVRI